MRRTILVVTGLVIMGLSHLAVAQEIPTEDVAVSDGRKIDADGRCKTPVGSTVNIAEATYENSIGDAMLMGYWKDPAFNPQERAFYYVRVIEIPTPRWTAYDAKRLGIQMPGYVPMTVTDRAYTSPIWYTPGS